MDINQIEADADRFFDDRDWQSYLETRRFNSTRSYYFREIIAVEDIERREYGGGKSLDDYTLSDFRDAWSEATRLATETRRRANNRWNHATQQWEQH